MCAPRVSVCARGRMKCPPPEGSFHFVIGETRTCRRVYLFIFIRFLFEKGPYVELNVLLLETTCMSIRDMSY